MHANQGSSRRRAEQDSVGAVGAGLTPAPHAPHPAAPRAAPPPQVRLVLRALRPPGPGPGHLGPRRALLLRPGPRRRHPQEETSD